jgi:glycosyltransferase involved in cell wall biosynthesis
MKPPRNSRSALRDNVHMWTDKIQHAEIIVGIPAYNAEETIGHVVSVVAEGLHEHFGSVSTAIFVSDGGSLDDTREEAYRAPVPAGVERRVSIYRGLGGKGASLRAIFELARVLDVRACAVFDADLRSISPAWVKCLIDPIWNGQAEFVAPYYQRDKYDGTITNHLVYPMTRALYGTRVRQPIGGDFGFSRRLADYYAAQDVWLTDVARFGIDIWMTTTAINENFKVVQADLGVKRHNPKDPSADLGPMFCQVISTLFYMMGTYENVWRQVHGSRPVELRGSVNNGGPPDPVAVSYEKMMAEFVEGFGQFGPLYREIVDPESHQELMDCVRAAEQDEVSHLSAELWAKVVYDFAYTYQTWHRNRRRLVDLLVPLYFGRTAAYCRQVAGMDSDQAESVVEEQAKTFEALKPNLIRRFKAWEG